MREEEFAAGIITLAEAGLNLFASLACAALPVELSATMESAGIPVRQFRRLVLIGHGGRRLWAALQAWGMETADPVDHYSTVHTRQFIDAHLPDSETFWLYPDTPLLAPLQQLGQLAGWSHPSPLGQGIHPVYGVWFAYRTAFLTTAELPLRTEPPRPSPCETCADRPCVSTCPVGAVRMGDFDVDGCARYRISEGSPCADRCLARMACPFFPEHRYTLPQIQYHYRQSLVSLREWYGGSGDGA